MWFGAFLIFVAVPLLELALLIKVGQSIGFWPTMAIIVLTAGLGVAVMQSHGIKTMQRLQAALADDKTPVPSVVDGTFVMFAGLLLISPGLITDVLGLLLLIPPLRRAVGTWSVERLRASGKVHTWTYSSSTYSNTGSTTGGPTTGGPERFERPSAGPLDSRPTDSGGHDNAAEPSAKRWPPKPGTRSSRGSGQVIDGEFERIDEKTIKPRPSKDAS
jgi:UPF0716 protein FxsA